VLAGPPPHPGGILPAESSSKVNTLGTGVAAVFSVAAVWACKGGRSTAQIRARTIFNICGSIVLHKILPPITEASILRCTNGLTIAVTVGITTSHVDVSLILKLTKRPVACRQTAEQRPSRTMPEVTLLSKSAAPGMNLLKSPAGTTQMSWIAVKLRGHPDLTVHFRCPFLQIGLRNWTLEVEKDTGRKIYIVLLAVT
jgi:hypothetical protein